MYLKPSDQVSPDTMEHLQTISDLSDARLEPFRDLRHRRSKLPDNRFIAEGQLVVQRLLATSFHVESIVVEEGKHPWVEAWRERCPVFRLSKTCIRQLAGFDFHRGVLASAQRPPRRGIEDLLPGGPCESAPHGGSQPPDARRPSAARRPPMLLFVCGISDKENMGSIIRSATAFGITDIVYDGATAEPYATRVLRVSMGTALKQRFYFSDNIVEDVRRLSHVGGYRTVATTLKPGTADLDSLTRGQLSDSPPVALLIGSEANGLPAEVERVATDRVMIPMRGQTDSLNASVATGILLYAITRAMPDR